MKYNSLEEFRQTGGDKWLESRLSDDSINRLLVKSVESAGIQTARKSMESIEPSILLGMLIAYNDILNNLTSRTLTMPDSKMQKSVVLALTLCFVTNYLLCKKLGLKIPEINAVDTPEKLLSKSPIESIVNEMSNDTGPTALLFPTKSTKFEA